MKMEVTGKMFCVLMLLLHKSVQQQAFNNNATLNLPTNYTVGWMRTLDDEKLISEVNIPGTHDTMALLQVPGSQCQSWPLENQLKAGIRYLDLRVYGRFVIIMHGVIPQFTTFAEVFNTTKNFLSQYKTETVLMRVKEEFGGNITEKAIIQVKNDPGCWISNKIPRIGDVRGKIVFVQKNSFKLGIPLLETDQKSDYKVKNISEKEVKITEHLKQALGALKTDRAVLSYSSGTGLPLWRIWNTPNHVAKKINPWLYGYLRGISKQNPKGCFGIIAMDFPGFDLIQQIIGFNN
ncbi:1-phosphatidylinositol phosphodiesterase-like [Danio aesculapii]|uniref:1-phosphatidylinositol phosphodiesterase-like n=1 Tax=Danio aesculapii TaxID=1142201 RepID=UPI0024BF61E3|nr:1-phosphatidylinositol phosphodiesterase-like [Danio aesculapii]